MTMLNPLILAEPQILFMIQTTKEKIEDIKNSIKRKNMKLLWGENSDSSLNESMFSNNEEY